MVEQDYNTNQQNQNHPVPLTNDIGLPISQSIDFDNEVDSLGMRTINLSCESLSKHAANVILPG